MEKRSTSSPWVTHEAACDPQARSQDSATSVPSSAVATVRSQLRASLADRTLPTMSARAPRSRTPPPTAKIGTIDPFFFLAPGGAPMAGGRFAWEIRTGSGTVAVAVLPDETGPEMGPDP